ncbi:hypothetical protein [Streptomyces chartreusis]|uniref:hypothetical protein n=1 Tax=Streptomyces chartreusis TaxID=1969 RepID=UPI0035E1DB3E
MQQRFDTQLSWQGDLNDHAAENSHYFPDLITATHLIKLSWPRGSDLLPSGPLTDRVDDHVGPILSAITSQRERTGSTTLTGTRTAPDDPVVCGALLLAADRLLGERDPATLIERVEPLAFEAFQRTKDYTARLLRDGGISTNLARATSRREPGFRARSRLRRASRSYDYRVEEVPPLLPRPWFDHHFAGFTQRLSNANYRDDRLLRRGASFKLAELVTSRTWPECSALLGVNSGVGRYTLNALGRRLGPVGLWPLFLSTVEQIAVELDGQAELIDYANRRRQLTNWHLPDTDWSLLYAGFPRLEHMQATIDPDVVSVVVWCEVNQSESSHSPIVRSTRDRGGDGLALTRRASTLNPLALGQGQRWRLRRRLEIYAARLGRACDRGVPLDISMAAVVAEESRSDGTAPLESSQSPPRSPSIFASTASGDGSHR